MSHLHLKKEDLAMVIKALDHHYGEHGDYEHAKTLATVFNHVSKDRNHLSVEFGRWEDDQPQPAATATLAPAAN